MLSDLSNRLLAPAMALGLCIGLGLSVAGFYIYKGIYEVKLGDRYVTVKGLVERLEKADRGTWDVTLKTTGNELAPLYKKLSHDADEVQKFVLAAGFDQKEISISTPKVTDLHAREYGTGTLAPERYQVEYMVSVNSQKVDVLNTLSAKAGDLLTQGISISGSETKFYLDRFNELRPQLIADSTQNAQEVAEGFAKTTGSHIGGIRKANQGAIRVTSPDASPNNEYDEGAASLMKKVRLVSTIEFYIQ